ncbi:MAG: glycosyltransferase family 4 protein [Pseudomonadota bacterium]
MLPRIAVYSPTPAAYADHPTGERSILAVTRAALSLARFQPFDVAAPRAFDKTGDADLQSRLIREAQAVAQRLTSSWAGQPPALWYTYHSYYKAPDLVGPAVSRALGIPYVIQQPSISRRRLNGPHRAFAQANLEACAAADLLFWPTERDLDGLCAEGHGDKLCYLPPSVGALPHAAPAQAAKSPIHLLTVARMQPGAKQESYHRLAAGLAALADDGGDQAWTLTVIGDGPAAADVRAPFHALGDRVRFIGSMSQAEVAEIYPSADLLLWPGFEEGVGMVYLEAQAHGVPVIAEELAGRAAFIANRLAAPNDPADYARLIRETLDRRQALSAAARGRIQAFHAPQAAADILRRALMPLIA